MIILQSLLTAWRDCWNCSSPSFAPSNRHPRYFILPFHCISSSIGFHPASCITILTGTTLPFLHNGDPLLKSNQTILSLDGTIVSWKIIMNADTISAFFCRNLGSDAIETKSSAYARSPTTELYSSFTLILKSPVPIISSALRNISYIQSQLRGLVTSPCPVPLLASKNSRPSSPRPSSPSSPHLS